MTQRRRRQLEEHAALDDDPRCARFRHRGHIGGSSSDLISLFVLTALAVGRARLFWMFLTSDQGRLPQFVERPTLRGTPLWNVPAARQTFRTAASSATNAALPSRSAAPRVVP